MSRLFRATSKHTCFGPNLHHAEFNLEVQVSDSETIFYSVAYTGKSEELAWGKVLHHLHASPWFQAFKEQGIRVSGPLRGKI